MPRKSTVKALPPEILAEVNRLLTQDLASLDEIVARLRALGHPRSRSAIGRHKQRLDQVAEKLRRSREMAAALVREIGPDAAEGKTGRLLVEILQNLVFEHLLKRSEEDGDDDDADPMGSGDFFFLAKAIKELASASKIDLDRELRIRRDVAVQAAETAVKAAEAEGLSDATIARIRGNILGVAT